MDKRENEIENENKQSIIESDEFLSRNQTLTQSSFKNSLPTSKQQDA
jgi:hypothetical protein